MPDIETPAAPAAETEFDRSALESAVASNMAEVFGDDTPVDDVEQVETPADPAETETPATDAEKEAAAKGVTAEGDAETKEDEVVEEAAAEGEKPADKAGEVSKAPTLPAAYRRSLKAYEWTDEEIDRAATDPNFLTTAAKIHATRNAETAKTAELGRQARQQNTTQQQDTSAAITALKLVDSAALKKQYGEDALIDSIVSPINAVVEQINKILPVIQQTQQKSQTAELETLGRQIEGFFGGAELKPYTELYGLDLSKLNDKQLESRNKVLETADALIVGAKLQGRTMSLGDALTLAHDSVSGTFKTQAARTTIKTQLKARERGITLKPGNRGSNIAANGAGKVSSRGDLEKKVKAGLASVFA